MAPLEDIINPAPLAAPRLSLLAAIQVHEVIVDQNGRPTTSTTAVNVDGEPWREAAITFTPEPCGGEGGVFDPSCGIQAVDISGDESTVKVPEHFQAFGVFEPETCSNFGWAGLDTDARARRAITLDEAKQVERELWKGVQAQASGWTTNRWLARNAADGSGNPPAATILKASVAQAPVRALAELEAEIASRRSGGRAIIHATRRTVTFWVHNQLLYRAGNTLLTIATDTVVVPGEGYDGSSPAGAVDASGDTDWAYATGPIEALRGPVELLRPSSPEQTVNNRRTSIAKRQYALVIDPCVHVAIKVNNS